MINDDWRLDHRNKAECMLGSKMITLDDLGDTENQDDQWMFSSSCHCSKGLS